MGTVSTRSARSKSGCGHGSGTARCAVAWLLFGCALLSAPGVERASAQPATGAGASPGVEAPRAVALADIPTQFLADRARLEQIAERSASEAKVGPLRNDLLQLLEEIETRRHEDLAVIEQITDRRALDGIASTWAEREARLDEIERTLARGSSALARDLGELVDLRARWEATHESLSTVGGSDILLEGVRTLLVRIGASQREVERRIRPSVQQEGRLETAREHARHVEQGIADARRRIRSLLFRIDSPPLWAAEAEIEGGYRAAIVQNATRARDATLEFAKQRAEQLLLFAAFGLAFIASLVLLRRSVARANDQDPDVAGMAAILKRPFAGGFLIVLMAGVLVVFPAAPDLVKGTTGVALLWPLRRLLALSILPGFRASFIGIGFLFIVDTARLLLLPESLLSRVVLLGESLGGIWLIYWLRRPSRLAHLGEAGLMLRAVGLALRFATPLLLISLVSNLAGNVSLAEALDRGTLYSLFLTYFIYAAFGVLRAAFAALLHTRTAQLSRIVRYHRRLLIDRGERFLQLVCTLLWVAVVAQTFGLADFVYGGIWSALTTTFTLGKLELTLGDFARFGVMVWLSFVISRFLRFVLEEDVLSRASLPRGVPFAISAMVRYVVLLIGFVLAAAAAGVDISSFTLIASALGVGVGIGLQGVVNNFVSGLILLFERPIQLGDSVEVGQMIGTVRRIGLRSSTIRTYDGSEVVIPNSEFVSNQFVNWTLSDRNRRIRLPVGVAYGSDPERVIELLIGAAKATPTISPHPAPEALFIGFGESTLDFELRAWSPNFDDWLSVKSALTVAVNAALREAGIEIPFPQRDLHLRSVPPAQDSEAGGRADESSSDGERSS